MMAEPNQMIEKPSNPKRRYYMTLLAAIFIGIALLWFIYWLGWGRYYDYTDDAYVAGNQVQLMPQVAGTVVAINTDDTDLVVAGQPLVELQHADTWVQLQQAKANLAQTVRQVRQYYEDVPQAKAEVMVRAADLLQAQRNLQRRIGLVGALAISREELQDHQTSVAAAQAQYDLAKHKLASAIALVVNTHLYTHPLVQQAKARFKAAYLAYVRTTIYAPVQGYTAKRSVQVGQQVTPGTALLAIVPLNQIWVDANFKETQLERIRIGQEVSLIADANDFTYHGKVQGLEAGTGSAFAILPPQNATGNWIKIVQRVPVRIILDPRELKEHPLQIGLSMRVTVYTRHKKGLILAVVPQQKPLYTTPIFDDQLAHVNQLIKTIIHANAPDNVGMSHA